MTIELGLVGLGRMGGNIRDRLRERGLEAVGYDPNDDGSMDSLVALVDVLPTPRTVWVMVPSGAATRQVIEKLAGLLAPGDLVVDGSDPAPTENAINADILARYGIRHLECGVSGGVWERQIGYALLAGGAAVDIDHEDSRGDEVRPGEGYYAELTPDGSERGAMQDHVEGYELLTSDESVVDVPAVLRAWSTRTASQSWLLDLLVHALSGDPELASTSGYVEHPGEGLWTVEEALSHGVPAPVISAGLFAQFASRQGHLQAMRAVSDRRNRSGGNAVRRSESVRTA